MARFRGNAFYQKGFLGAAFPLIPAMVPTIEQLGLAEVLKELVTKNQGLFLVTGPTGSGKSTTLAALIDYVNATHPVHIITLEDPIEFVYEDKKAIVNQREIGADTLAFSQGLRRALRQDPDIILIGELRDAETIVMCHAGGRSMRVAQYLSNQGFTNVANLAGGIAAWSDEVDATVPHY